MAYYVRDLDRSITFYQQVVGLALVGHIFKGRAAIMGGGQSHHELLLIQMNVADGPIVGRRIGLYHTGWKIGNSLNDLCNAMERAKTHGAQIDGTADHGILYSLYLRDPDNNEVELFTDNANFNWHEDSSWMEKPSKPLDLSFTGLQRMLMANAINGQVTADKGNAATAAAAAKPSTAGEDVTKPQPENIKSAPKTVVETKAAMSNSTQHITPQHPVTTTVTSQPDEKLQEVNIPVSQTTKTSLANQDTQVHNQPNMLHQTGTLV